MSDISAYLAAHPKVSVETFLSVLSKDLRSRYQLPYEDDRTPHGASIEFPGIRLGSPEGSTLISLAGASHMRNGNRVDFLAVDPKTAQLVSYSKNFDGSKSPLVRQPRSCLKCHSNTKAEDALVAPIRPLWDRYPEWAGVIGSSHNGILYNQRYGSSRTPTFEFEEEALQRLQKNPSSRYSLLEGFQMATLESLSASNTTFNDTLTRIQYKNLLSVYQEKLQQAYLNGTYQTIRQEIQEYLRTSKLPDRFPENFIKELNSIGAEKVTLAQQFKVERMLKLVKKYGTPSDQRLLEEIPKKVSNTYPMFSSAESLFPLVLAGIDPMGFDTTLELGTFASTTSGPSLMQDFLLELKQMVNDPTQPASFSPHSFCNQLYIPSFTKSSPLWELDSWLRYISKSRLH